MLTRRGLIGGLASLLAAPAIVKAASLMPVKALPADPLELALRDGGWVEYKFDGKSSLIRVQYRIVQATADDVSAVARAA